MDDRARRRFRERLQALRDEIIQEGDIAIEPGRKDPAAVGTDDDEQPLAEMSQTISSARNRTRAAVLARVQAALKRLADTPEEFGLCTECEEPISAKRLELMPYVELCVQCQDASDGPHKTGGRRHLRDFR